MYKMNILVTGGCGFIGSHFIEEVMKNDNVGCLVNLDKLTYAANKNLRFSDIYKSRYIESNIDINNERILSILLDPFMITHVVHFAAESHVDNSIVDSSIFIKTNINGTHNLLECCRKYGKMQKFIHVSTDEVFGSLNFTDTPFTKESPYRPNSPYAASKAASDLLVKSYVKTYNFPAIITNCSNNYGPRQFPEKLIPLALKRLREGNRIPIYGKGENIRDWIYVKDHAKALTSILECGKVGNQYLIGGEKEISNIDLIEYIVKKYQSISGKSIRNDYFEYVTDRKGHDLRYSIDFTEFKKEFPDFELTPFDIAIENTIKSYE